MSAQPVEQSTGLRASASWTLWALVAVAVALPWLLEGSRDGLPALRWKRSLARYSLGSLRLTSASDGVCTQS